MTTEPQLETLIERTRAGDLSAFEEIVRRFQDMAVGYAHGVLRDFGAAEDAAQEAFLEALRSLDQLREPRAFPGWLRRILFKQCDRIVRKRRPIPSADVEGDAGEPDAAAVLEGRERQARVLSAVSGLPEHQRVVTTLFHLRQQSQREIAEFLDIPVGTVKTRLHAAKEALRGQLEETLEEAFEPHRPSRDRELARRTLGLAHAAYFGDVARTRELLKERPGLARGTFSWFWYWRWEGGGWTPLHRAVEQGRVELCELLIEHGADLEASSPGGWKPLHMAFGHRGGEQPVAQMLRERGAVLDAFAAAGAGDVEALAALDVHAPCPEGATPLHFAGSAEVVEALVARGLAPTRRCAGNRARPLRWLLAHGRAPEVVQALIAHGAELDLIDAVTLGDRALAETRLKTDPDAVFRPLPERCLVGKAGSSLLNLAAGRGHAEVVRLLLAHGADENGLGDRGALPLSQACFNACSDAVRALLEAGADPRRMDRDFEAPPLWVALFPSVMPWQSREDLLETLGLLIEAGADVQQRNRAGVTPIELLESRGQRDLIEHLGALTRARETETNR